jgi:hypothetical protein
LTERITAPIVKGLRWLYMSKLWQRTFNPKSGPPRRGWVTSFGSVPADCFLPSAGGRMRKRNQPS